MIKNSKEKKHYLLLKEITEPKISYIILWEYFYDFERHMLYR